MSNPRSKQSESKVIDAKQFARLLKVDRATIYKRRIAGEIPEPSRITGKMHWVVKTVCKKRSR